MDFNLEEYLNDGMKQLVKDTLRVTLKNPRQSAFFLQFAAAAQKAAGRRHALEQAGEHIPSFLIASITDDCNLQCAGCYAQANRAGQGPRELTAAVWRRIFKEAESLGVSVILLAGGEPLLRRDVLEAAAEQPGILFPVVTNGTLLDDKALQLFTANRNLVPVISIEGDEMATDFRRGKGVYLQIVETMVSLRKRGLLFGASITVTSENLDSVTNSDFVEELEKGGCKVILFVEYVPVENAGLALDDQGRARLTARVNEMRAQQEGIILVSFPGDEAEAGGCLAAGRGFFHINASGGAEPCPFSPYSDLNLGEASLREALQSPFFTRLREEGILAADHNGGCVLFEQKEKVEQLAKG